MKLDESINNFLIYCERKELDNKTIRAYRFDLKQFCEISRTVGIDDVSNLTVDVILLANEVWQKNLKNRTVYRKNASLRVFMEYLWKQNYTEKNLYKAANIIFKRKKLDDPAIITVDDIQTLLNRSEKEWKDKDSEKDLRNLVIVEMLIYSGLRISEICALSITDILFTDDSYIIQIKGYRKRNVCIANKNATEHLKIYSRLYGLEIARENKLFINRSGRPISDQSIRRIIKKFAEPLHVNVEVTPKILRNTLASNVAKSMQNTRELQSFLGDKSFTSTERHLKKKDVLPVHVIMPENVY